MSDNRERALLLACSQQDADRWKRTNHVVASAYFVLVVVEPQRLHGLVLDEESVVFRTDDFRAGAGIREKLVEETLRTRYRK